MTLPYGGPQHPHVLPVNHQIGSFQTQTTLRILSCSLFPDRRKSHCQRGMSGPGVPSSCSCLCLPFGSMRLQSDSCEWEQWGAGLRSTSHCIGLMGSVSCWLRNPSVSGAKSELAHYAFNIAHTQPCALLIWHFYKHGLLTGPTLSITTVK